MSVKSGDSKVPETKPEVPELVLEQMSRKERLSSAFTIACSGAQDCFARNDFPLMMQPGFALISDGLQNVNYSTERWQRVSLAFSEYHVAHERRLWPTFWLQGI
jgi:hypothetical protein